MTMRLLISLPIGLGIVIIMSAMGVSQAIAVGICIGTGALASVLVDSRKDPRPAWGWAIAHGVAIGLCATLLLFWLR
jgi:hypothetical protein